MLPYSVTRPQHVETSCSSVKWPLTYLTVSVDLLQLFNDLTLILQQRDGLLWCGQLPPRSSHPHKSSCPHATAQGVVQTGSAGCHRVGGGLQYRLTLVVLILAFYIISQRWDLFSGVAYFGWKPPLLTPVTSFVHEAPAMPLRTSSHPGSPNCPNMVQLLSRIFSLRWIHKATINLITKPAELNLFFSQGNDRQRYKWFNYLLGELNIFSKMRSLLRFAQ